MNIYRVPASPVKFSLPHLDTTFLGSLGGQRPRQPTATNTRGVVRLLTRVVLIANVELGGSPTLRKHTAIG